MDPGYGLSASGIRIHKGKKSEFYARQYFTEAKAVEGCGCATYVNVAAE